MTSITVPYQVKGLLQAGAFSMLLLLAVTGCGNTDSSEPDTSPDTQNNNPSNPINPNNPNNPDTNTSNIDSDSDSIADNVDNCIHVSNRDQSDLNSDNIGDACDPNYQAQLSIVLDE